MNKYKFSALMVLTIMMAILVGWSFSPVSLHNDGATWAWYGAIQTDVNDFRSNLRGDALFTTPSLAIGSTKTAVSNIAFTYVINGMGYNKAAVSTGTAPGNDVIPEGLYGAVALDIGTNGTVDAVEATANATGYATAALAAAGLPAVAADHARMGYVTASISSGTFTFGTTDLDAANTTVAYTLGASVFNGIDSTDLDRKSF